MCQPHNPYAKTPTNISTADDDNISIYESSLRLKGSVFAEMKDNDDAQNTVDDQPQEQNQAEKRGD